LGVAIGIVAFMNFMVTELMRSGQRSERMRTELARSEERVSLSRDVHDLLGHSLTVVKLKSELAERLLETDPVRAKQELHEIGSITSEALAGVRATVTGLRRGNVNLELENARTSLEAAGHAVYIVGDASGVPPVVGPQLAWVLREITTNILRHAHATEVSISWGPSSLTVEDDGDGLGALQMPEAASSISAGNGIRGMRERMATVGGNLVLGESNLGGAKVEVVW
jgi:two-component system sensor histidine kinase DesK